MTISRQVESTLVGQQNHCWTPLLDALVGRPCWTPLLDALVGRSCWTLLLDALVGRPCWMPLLDALAGRPCWTALLDTKYLYAPGKTIDLQDNPAFALQISLLCRLACRHWKLRWCDEVLCRAERLFCCVSDSPQILQTTVASTLECTLHGCAVVLTLAAADRRGWRRGLLGQTGTARSIPADLSLTPQAVSTDSAVQKKVRRIDET